MEPKFLVSIVADNYISSIRNGSVTYSIDALFLINRPTKCKKKNPTNINLIIARGQCTQPPCERGAPNHDLNQLPKRVVKL